MIVSSYQTIAKFKSKNGGDIYFVKQNQKTGELSCNCKGWVYLRRCKHIDYVKANPIIQLTDIPTYQQACDMVWGKDKEAKEKWVSAHLKEIEL